MSFGPLRPGVRACRQTTRRSQPSVSKVIISAAVSRGPAPGRSRGWCGPAFDIYNPDRGQGLDRRFQTRRVWPEGALAPEGQTCLVWNRRSSPARGLDCSSHMNFKPFMFLSVIYFRCPLTFPHPGLVPAFPCFSHSLPYFGHSVR